MGLDAVVVSGLQTVRVERVPAMTRARGTVAAMTTTPARQKYGPDRPIMLGDPDGADPVRAFTSARFASLPAGTELWVTGDGIADTVDAGMIRFPVDDAEPEPVAVAAAAKAAKAEAVERERADRAAAKAAKKSAKKPGLDAPVPNGDAADPLAGMNKKALKARAAELGIEGRSKMNVAALKAAIAASTN